MVHDVDIDLMHATAQYTHHITHIPVKVQTGMQDQNGKGGECVNDKIIYVHT